MNFRYGIGVGAMLVGIAASDAAIAQSSTSPFSGLFGGRDRSSVTSAGVEGPQVLLRFIIVEGDNALTTPLRNASVLAGALAEERTTGQDILAAARADYARALGVMYDEGYFSAVISITLDGVEAAEIAPLDAPSVVREVVVAVDPGPQFEFARADIAPLAPGTEPIDAYAVGEVAQTGVIRRATSEAIDDWRHYGAAKAEVGDSEIIADHDVARIESNVILNPGPVVTFGRLQMTGYERMNPRRLAKIAGFPEGERFDPDRVDDVRTRLRRTGVFSAITLVEAENLNPDNSLDMGLTVVEQKPRRIGAAFEISNVDGAMVSAYWMHRNLLGGAERLRIEAMVSDIKADRDAIDYALNLRIERPATLTPDTTAYIDLGAYLNREPDFREEIATASIGFTHYHSDELTADIALQYRWSRVDDAGFRSEFEAIALPTTVTWDKRDNPTDARDGFWLRGELTPFYGFGDTGSGLRAVGEGRVYRSFMTDDRLTLAGRARVGTIFGPDLAETPRDYLFYAGGGGSVRGLPFEHLGVEVLTDDNDEPIHTGGMSVATLSAEARFWVRENIGVVAFADAGQVWSGGSFSGSSDWIAGAGAGLRYRTPIGPLRFDIATPLRGETDNRIQLYLGLGQAF
ncbi:MAG: autotransporter assembly complex family protein [Paracoccus sp. (in: a-proteobacteria)]|nr:autotransporter assembly complex family protein [Paracoccus sp. (in: a-proteobacteria)]